ncbi:MAG: hypothetical protein ABSE42_15940 [Bryobacteraceae bacterium]
MAPKKKTKKFDLPKEVRAIARERVGRVPPGAVILPKPSRPKVKHKKRQDEEMESPEGERQ